MKEYNEPWEKLPLDNGFGVVVGEVFEDASGDAFAQFRSESKASRALSCVNACAGIPTEALEAGVVKEMVEALENISNAYWNQIEGRTNHAAVQIKYLSDARNIIEKIKE